MGRHPSGLALSSEKYLRRNSFHLAGSWPKHSRNSVLGATSLSQESAFNASFLIPLGHNRSMRNRTPSSFSTASYVRSILIIACAPSTPYGRPLSMLPLGALSGVPMACESAALSRERAPVQDFEF